MHILINKTKGRTQELQENDIPALVFTLVVNCKTHACYVRSQP